MQFIQVISIIYFFLKNSNKSPLDATAQSPFIFLKDHKSAKAITLTRESYENVVRQAAVEQEYKTENVAATKLRCKPVHTVITKFIDPDSKKEKLLVVGLTDSGKTSWFAPF